MRIGMKCGLNLFLLVSVALGQGCGDREQEIEDLCGPRIRLAVLEIWDIKSTKDPARRSYDSAAAALRELLANCKIPLDGISVSGDTRIQAAEIYLLAGYYEEVQAHLKDLDSLDYEQRASLLFTAARYGNLEILQAVVYNGVDVNTRDKVGNNAISGLVGSFAYTQEKLSFLIESGVDPVSENADGFSALDAAIFAGDRNLAGQILQYLDSNDPRSRAIVEDALDIASEIDSPLHSILAKWLEQA